MDSRAYDAGYCWSKDKDDEPTRVWTFRDGRAILAAGAVTEIKHSGYHCLLAKWDDVLKAASSNG